MLRSRLGSPSRLTRLGAIGILLLSCAGSGTTRPALTKAEAARPSRPATTKPPAQRASKPPATPHTWKSIPTASPPQSLPASLPALTDWVIGSAHPVLLRAAAANGSWTVLCQAREDSNHDGKVAVLVESHGQLSGDRLYSYFIRGGGLGDPIDQFLAQSPDGRFLAVQRDGRGYLLDTASGSATDLSALGLDLRDDQAPYLGHRGVRFDPSGRRMLYLRSVQIDGTTQNRVVIRQLDTNLERVIDPGPGMLWRADFDSTGNKLVLKLVTEDTNKNTRLEWPFPARREIDPGCIGPVPSFTVWEYPGDRPAIRIADVERGAVSDAPGYITSFGAGWLFRDEKFRLLLAGAAAPVELFSEACNARLLHSDPLNQLLVASCLNAKGGPSIELYSPGYRRVLPDLQVSPFEVDVAAAGSPLLLPLYTKQGTLILDLDTRTTSALGESDWVPATYGKRALVRRGETVYLWNAGKWTALAPKAQPMARTLQSGAMVLVPPLLVDMELGALRGEVKEPALAVTQSGAVLTAARRATDPSQLPTGPLRWVAP